MNLRFLTYLLVAIALLTSCSGFSMRQLERLEARVNDAPDSVLTVLTSSESPRWGEARALYALLTHTITADNGKEIGAKHKEYP